MTGVYKGSLSVQLDAFTHEIGVLFYRGASLRKADSWMDAFDALHQAIHEIPKNKKVVLF